MLNGKLEVFRDFSRGLVLAEDGIQPDLAYLIGGNNVEPIGHKGLRRRSGTKWSATVTQPTSNIQIIYGWIGGAWIYFDATAPGGIFQAGSATALKATWAASQSSDLVRAPTSTGTGHYYVMDSVNTPQLWDGNITHAFANWAATTGSVPNGQALAYVNNRLFAAVVPATPNRLFACAALDPLNWGTAVGQGYIVDFPDDGHFINSICPVGPYLLVFRGMAANTTNQGAGVIHVIYDTETGANRVLSRSHNVTNAGQVGDEAVLCCSDAVYITNGNTIRDISPQLPPTVAAVLGITGSVTLRGAIQPVGSRYVAVAASDGTVWIYDRRLDCWVRHSFAGGVATAIGPGNLAQTDLAVVTASPAQHHIQSFTPDHASDIANNATDDASGGSSLAFTGNAILNYFDAGDPARRKRLRAVNVEASCADAAQSLTVQISRDNDTSYTRSLALLQAGVQPGLAPGLIRALTPGVARQFGIQLASTSRWRAESITPVLSGRTD